ncbi:uncharacterized protein LOC144144934 [Haemaphysalis longicornis]
MLQKMISLYPLIAAMALLGTFNSVHSGQSFLENNPSLGSHQDETDCFPLQDTWFLIYRNFENDPYFGGSPKCIEFSEPGPFVNGSFPVIGTVGGNVTLDTVVTLMSSPGYTEKNVLNLRAVQAPDVNFNLTAAYRDCDRCMILRHSYIDGGKGCGLWQPDIALGEDISCCEFIYDLVCGTSPKFQVYEKCA